MDSKGVCLVQCIPKSFRERSEICRIVIADLKFNDLSVRQSIILDQFLGWLLLKAFYTVKIIVYNLDTHTDIYNVYYTLYTINSKGQLFVKEQPF